MVTAEIRVFQDVWSLEITLVRLSLLPFYLIKQVLHSITVEVLLLLGFVEARQQVLEGRFRLHEVPCNKVCLRRLQDFFLQVILKSRLLTIVSFFPVFKVVDHQRILHDSSWPI